MLSFTFLSYIFKNLKFKNHEMTLKYIKNKKYKKYMQWIIKKEKKKSEFNSSKIYSNEMLVWMWIKTE